MRRKKAGDIEAENIPVHTPKYTSQSDTSTTEATKTKLLYAIAGVFALVLVGIWFNSIRTSFKDQSDALGLARLTDEIKKGITQFDNKSTTTPTVNPVINLTAIKDSVEEDITNQLPTADWIDKAFASPGFSVKYPNGWTATTTAKLIIVKSFGKNGSSTEITIESLANAKKLGWDEWLKARPAELKNMLNVAAPLSASSSIAILKYSSASTTTENTYYLSALNSKQILKIKTQAGDNENLNAIIEKVIINIDLLK